MHFSPEPNNTPQKNRGKRIAQFKVRGESFFKAEYC